jgi:tetratricopeptide (TPR) repeat protein
MRGRLLTPLTIFLLALPALRAQDSFERLAESARAALEAERTDEAVRLYAQATELRPEWAEGWWRLGTLHYDGGDFPAARDAFTRFVALEVKAGPGFGMLGLAEFRLQQYSAALAALEQGIRLGLGPNWDFEREVLGRDATLHSLFGRPEIALQRLTLLMNKTAAAHPGAATAALLADLETVDAMGIAALRIPQLPAAVPADKASLVRQAGRAQALFALQDLPAAAREFAQLAAAYANEPGVHYAYGTFLLKTNPPAALAQFQKEIEVSPKDAAARVQAAVECLRTADYSAGRQYASEAVALAPRDFGARIVLARLLLAQDQVTDALEQSLAAVKLAPESPDAHFVLSRCYAQSNRPREAERERAEFQRLKDLADRSQ